MARITKAQIIEATKVAARIDPSQFNFEGNWSRRCRKKRGRSLCRCTRERYHKGPHVAVWPWSDDTLQGIWFSADQRMKDMYEHYRD